MPRHGRRGARPGLAAGRHGPAVAHRCRGLGHGGHGRQEGQLAACDGLLGRDPTGFRAPLAYKKDGEMVRNGGL